MTAVDEDPAGLVPLIRERLYAALTSLSVLVVLAVNPDAQGPGEAARAVGVAVVALAVAGTFADLTAYTAAHGRFPHGAQLRHVLAVGGQALSAAVLPLGALALAGAGALTVRHALEAGIAAEVVAVGAITWWATSRTALPRPRQVGFVALAMAVGLLVLGFKVFVQH